MEDIRELIKKTKNNILKKEKTKSFLSEYKNLKIIFIFKIFKDHEKMYLLWKRNCR